MSAARANTTRRVARHATRALSRRRASGARPLLLTSLLACWPVAAAAHPLDPALLELHEQPHGRVDVVFQTPRPIQLHASLPADCHALSEPELRMTERRALQRWQAQCGQGGLVGRRVGIEGLGARRSDGVLRVELLDGGVFQAVLRPDAASAVVAAPPGPAAIAASYLKLGLEHILGGLDHLLFVLGLVLLVRGTRRLLWTITAFTVGHSITLACAVLGLVRLPPAPIEVLIALSIAAVAAELARPRAAGGALPIWLALGFGLLHGLGFAGALAEIGLPEGEIPLALFAFNCGIEIGQLLFVALVLAARRLLRALPIRWPAPARLLPAYAIGSLAFFWVWQRLLAMV